MNFMSLVPVILVFVLYFTGMPVAFALIAATQIGRAHV